MEGFVIHVAPLANSSIAVKLKVFVTEAWLEAGVVEGTAPVQFEHCRNCQNDTIHELALYNS